MNASLKIQNYIKGIEKLRLMPYDDPGGPDAGSVDTIGWGHFLLPGESYPAGISVSKAEELFQQDLKKAEDAVKRYITVPLTQNQFDALVSWVWNCGAGALQKSYLRTLINKSAPQADIYKRWTTTYIMNNGVVLSGLIDRRKYEADLFFSDPWQPVNKKNSLPLVALSIVCLFTLIYIFK